MELRGFDDYEVTLGDEIRGERASLGKSLEEVERELHIKAELIQAIENCDLGGFPNHSVVAGYVRSYARYLRMDPEAFYARFCAETGFQAPSSAFGVNRGGAGGSGSGSGRMLSGSPFDQSRFAAPPTRTRFDARVSFGSLASGVALLMLCGGLGYGGYALLQNIQKVGFAPLPQAPDVATDAPELETVLAEADALPRPPADVYSGSGALAAVFAPNDLPPVSRRDGPISAIDPVQAGLFQGSEPRVAPRTAEPEPEGPLQARTATGQAPARDLASVPVGAMEEALAVLKADPASPFRAAHAGRAGDRGDALPGAEVVAAGIAIEVEDAAWIRVRDGSRAIIFEGTLPTGERFELPERIEAAELRAGNAGAVFVRIDGTRFGPVGLPGSVVKNISLKRVDVMAAFPKAPGSSGVANLAVEARATVDED